MDHSLRRFTILAALAARRTANPNDWVNIDYVINRAAPDSTLTAQGSISDDARSTASNGPWSIITPNILPPSKNAHDYLSWAPYHWPDCNWCTSSHDATSTDTNESGSVLSGLTSPNCSLALNTTVPIVGSLSCSSSHHQRAVQGGILDTLVPLVQPLVNQTCLVPAIQKVEALLHLPRAGLPGSSAASSSAFSSFSISPSKTSSIPTFGTNSKPVQASVTPVIINGSPTGNISPEDTKKGKCTPSTTSVAPSATWTTCPYVVRDGQVNPDTRDLRGSSAIVEASDSIFFNAISFALTGMSDYEQNAVTAIDTFFLTTATKMRPNMNFGQVVRGPGTKGQEGTFTGVLDLRGIVKIVNAVLILRSKNSTDWTYKRDHEMVLWMEQYVNWLETTSIAKTAASRPNNHGSFFASQSAAAHILIGDNSGAKKALDDYFKGTFKDQIAKSGEQPFEAVRTRPYHYRCFNLEAMITNAKIGDQLGMSYWNTESKYGGTIQTALDYTMSLDPGSEKLSEVFPHVATVAAAYGDPNGKYAAFLQRNDPSYESQPYFYYDQSAALPHAPAQRKTRRSGPLENCEYTIAETMDQG
ncbi:hypothetical protein HYDPIDRAFT_24584 [Hydnomerulius pinastri MD-312]|nr:hypothetical protein HYDPIDRAFT_24584 [Hydnomerulius pinastri MD-312]